MGYSSWSHKESNVTEHTCMREVAFISKHITFLAEKKKNVVNE